MLSGGGHLLDDSRWIPSHCHKIRHILGHHAPRANSNTLADGHAWEDDAVASKPAVRSDLDSTLPYSGPLVPLRRCGSRGWAAL